MLANAVAEAENVLATADDGAGGESIGRLLDPEERTRVRIARIMDDFVSSHPWARGGYVDGSRAREEVLASQPDGPEGVPAIQQVREEILDFVEQLLQRGVSGGSILEIGLGFVGGTHFLWTHMFRQVVTVEHYEDRITRFLDEIGIDALQSLIVCGESNSDDVLLTVGRAVRSCDVLFIDGSHVRDAVEADWRRYVHLVRKGGIVAFHDTIVDHPGNREVAGFIEALESGMITGAPVKFVHIHHSVYVGISYYVVE